MLGVAGIAGVAALGALATRAKAGPIDPPVGPVGSTGKTISEAVPRTPLSAANTPGDSTAVYVITQTGSYYLTGNVTSPSGKAAVRIEASNVTLDLNGFEILGAGTGIVVPFASPATVITVRNGTLRGGGGVGLSGVRLVRVEDLTIAGTPFAGVAVGDDSVVRRVISDGNGTTGALSSYHGISAGARSLISDCMCRSNPGAGISASDGSVVSGCTVSSNGSGGISVGTDGVIAHCTSLNNTATGIYGNSGSVIESCVAGANTGGGISAASGATIRACTARANAGVGITVSESGLIEDSTSTLNSGATSHGIVTGGGSTISRCTSNQNGGSGIVANTSGSGTTPGTVIERCNVRLNTSYGILAGGGCVIRDNNLVSNATVVGTASMRVMGTGCRIEGNQVVHSAFNGFGIQVNTSGCVVVRNSCRGHTFNYSIDTNNVYGSVYNGTVASTGMSGNGTSISTFSADPWANVAF